MKSGRVSYHMPEMTVKMLFAELISMSKQLILSRDVEGLSKGVAALEIDEQPSQNKMGE